MIETKEKQLNDELTLKVTQFSARKALKLATRISKLIGPSIAAIAEKAKDINKAEAKEKEKAIPIGEAVTSLVDKLDDEATTKLVVDLLSSSHLNDLSLEKEANFDKAFSGNNLALLPEAITFVLETNFGSFLEKLMATVNTG